MAKCSPHISRCTIFVLLLCRSAFDVEGLWGAWSFAGEPKSSITMIDGERRELRTFMDCSGNGHHAVQLKESTRVVAMKPKVPERLAAYHAAWSP